MPYPQRKQDTPSAFHVIYLQGSWICFIHLIWPVFFGRRLQRSEPTFKASNQHSMSQHDHDTAGPTRSQQLAHVYSCFAIKTRVIGQIWAAYLLSCIIDTLRALPRYTYRVTARGTLVSLDTNHHEWWHCIATSATTLPRVSTTQSIFNLLQHLPFGCNSGDYYILHKKHPFRTV